MNKWYFKCANCGRKKARLAEWPIFIKCDRCGYEVTEKDIKTMITYIKEAFESFQKGLQILTEKIIDLMSRCKSPHEKP